MKNRSEELWLAIAMWLLLMIVPILLFFVVGR